MWNMERIRLPALEQMSFENVDGRTDAGCRIYYKLNYEPSAQGANNVAHPKHPEEEEISPNRNHIITGKQQQKKLARGS